MDSTPKNKRRTTISIDLPFGAEEATVRINHKKPYVCLGCREDFDEAQKECPTCGDRRVRKREKAKPARETATHSVSLENAKTTKTPRWKTGVAFFDEATGGGVPKKKAILLAGQRGAGKSSVSIPVSLGVAKASKDKVLIASSEETEEAVASRAARLGAAGNPNIHIIARRGLTFEEVEAAVQEIRPTFVVIDSLQAMGTSLREEDLAKLIVKTLCDVYECSVLIIGQFTKDGQFSGSNKVAHEVDILMELSLDILTKIRRLNVLKNREGSDAEVIELRMTDKGLVRASSATGVLAEDREAIPGCVACPVIINGGMKIVEILCSLTRREAPEPDDEGNVAPSRRGERKAIKLESDRVKLVASLLERECDLDLSGEIYMEAVVDEGMSVSDRGADLAIAAAIVSAYKNEAFPRDCAVMGSVDVLGRTSEPVRNDERLRALAEYGYMYAVVHGTGGPLIPHPIRKLNELVARSWPESKPRSLTVSNVPIVDKIIPKKREKAQTPLDADGLPDFDAPQVNMGKVIEPTDDEVAEEDLPF